MVRKGPDGKGVNVIRANDDAQKRILIDSANPNANVNASAAKALQRAPLNSLFHHLSALA